MLGLFRLARYIICPEHLEAAWGRGQRAGHRTRHLHHSVAQDPSDPLSVLHCSAYADSAAFERHIQNAYMLERINSVSQPAMTAPPQFGRYPVLSSTSKLKPV